MSLSYRILYAVGFTPWEMMARPPMSDQIEGLIAREESEREPPYGRALDLGCGSGNWAVRLAERGWQVTGVDFVPKALRRARKHAEETGVEVDFHQGDVTNLGAGGIGSGFDFLLDVGCFHDELTDEQRSAEGREDIQASFPEWELIDEVELDVPDSAPGYVRKAEPRFYRLRRA